jgi:hypothetical protein
MSHAKPNQTLLGCGDIEANPGPDGGPCGFTSIRTYLCQHQLTDLFKVICLRNYFDGLCGSDGQPRRTTIGCVLCTLCDTTFECTDLAQIDRHYRSCVLGLDQTTHTPPQTGGRGADLLTCGGVESNPGPMHEREDMQDDPAHRPLADLQPARLPGPIRVRNRSALRAADSTNAQVPGHIPPERGALVANIELAMAHSTDNVGNLAHPGVLMDSVDLAHYDVRQGASSSSNVNPPARQNPLQPARAADMPCGFQTLMQSRVFTVKQSRLLVRKG